jgi:hypothetical protein
LFIPFAINNPHQNPSETFGGIKTMKAIFTLLLATVFTSAFARNEGKLTISIVSNKAYQVYVDGRQYQDNDGIFTLNNIQSGNHTIQVYRQGRNNNGNGRNRNNYDRRGELVYSSTVYVRPSYPVDVLINRFGKALVDERALNEKSGRWDEDEWGNGGYNNGYNQAISDYEFNQLLQRIRNQWFGRLGNAKDAINNNYFYTSQTRQLLELFTSESEKLELAKLSYAKIVDRQNFRQLYDLFSYSSQAELDRFIRDNRY